MNRNLSTDIMERFFNKVEVLDDGCWHWTGTKIWSGYSQFWVRTTPFSGHRFAYLVFRGNLSPGKQLDHLCRNRACVNPEHLEEVTAKVNHQRGDGPWSTRKRPTHCPQGHPYTGNNIALRSSPSEGYIRRRCRKCLNTYLRNYRARKPSNQEALL